MTMAAKHSIAGQNMVPGMCVVDCTCGWRCDPYSTVVGSRRAFLEHVTTSIVADNAWAGSYFVDVDDQNEAAS